MGNAKKEDAVKDRKNTNTIRNEQQKAKSRIAAKNRRQKENENIEQLQRLVPWIPDNPPDKSTTIRLTTSYIGLMRVLNGSRNRQIIGNGCSATQGIENFSLEVLDGFVIILNKDGTVTFVNEKVVNYLGIPPHELMGKKIYNFVLRKDWELVAKKLRGPLPSLDNPNVNEPVDDPDDVICEPDASELFKPFFDKGALDDKIEFSVRMQCNLIRRTNSSKSTSYQIVRFTGKLNADGSFLGTGEHAWSPDLGDLPVFEPAFISRLTPDLKLLFCEGRIHRYMDSEAKDIVGRVVYPFYHPNDLFHIQKMHSKLLAEGKVTTVPYRWMNKDGGWVWLKSTTTRIQDQTSGKTYMVCVNYVLSAIENKGVVVGVNPETRGEVIERKNNENENEKDSDDAYLVDELTNAFFRHDPFGAAAPKNGELQGGDGQAPNAFYNYPRNKPRYTPSFTPEERNANPLQEFNHPAQQQSHASQNSSSLREQADQHFENFSWPRGEHAWPSVETKWQHNDFTGALHNNQHLDQLSLQDLITNGQFSCDFLPLNLPTNGEPGYTHGNCELEQNEAEQLTYIEEQYKRSCLEESFKQESNQFVSSGHVKTEPGNPLPMDTFGVLADPFDINDLASFLPEEEDMNQEDKAYQASLYLFMNEVPSGGSKLPPSTAMVTSEVNTTSTYPYHHRHTNGFTQGMTTNNQEQCYPQLNHNNNNFHGGIMNLAPLSEESCILDFDEMLLNA